MASGTTWLDTEEQQIWRLLLRVHARLLTRLDDDLERAHGIGLADYDVLVQLSEVPDGSLRMAELASRLQLSPSGLTRRIDSMVRRGLVTREPCDSDGRGSFAVLSAEGLATLEEAAPTHVAGVRRYLFDALEPRTWARLADSLAKLDAGLDDAAGVPASQRGALAGNAGT